MSPWTEDFIDNLCQSDPEYAVIPASTWGALARYITARIECGGFLDAVLRNNLKLAVTRADNHNKHAIAAIVKLLYNHAPMGCWGNDEAVTDWLS